MQGVGHQKLNLNLLSLRLVKVSGLCWYLWRGRNEERRHVVTSSRYRYGWGELQSTVTLAEFGKCEFRCSNSKSIGFYHLHFQEILEGFYLFDSTLAAQPTICIWFSSFQLSLNTFKPRLEFLVIIVNPSYSDNLKETMTSLKITDKLQTKNLVYKVTYFLTSTPDYNLHSKYIFPHYHMTAVELINCQEKAEIIFQL